jgi:signal transduction histidine kinase
VVPIIYDGRQLGRFVIGPFLPADVDEVPATLLAIDPDVKSERALRMLDEMPRVQQETARRISAHLRGILDLIMFSGHRAHLTSEMHLASVRESYRELAEKNAKLQQAYDRLKELDRLKSNFLATVSHELRTPLTSIIGYSEMLTEGIAGDMTEEQRGFVDTIRSKGELLLQLITNLLDLNKLERDQLTLSLQTIDPKAVLLDVKDMLRPDADKKGITMTLETAANLPMIKADPVRLRQVLINVAGNAVKFTPKNGNIVFGIKSTMLSTNDGDDEDAIGMAVLIAPESAIEFSITDSGIGMPEEELKRIFDAFYQVDGSSTREHGGTGLGLSIAKRLVDAHGGSIRVESQVNRGTTFFITLPENAEDSAS